MPFSSPNMVPAWREPRTCLARYRMGILEKLKRSSIAKDTGHLTIGQGLRLVLQATYFVAIARILGPTSYGAFASIIALTGIFTPFAGWGANSLFVKNVRSGKRPANLCWGNGLVMIFSSGLVLGGLVYAA